MNNLQTEIKALSDEQLLQEINKIDSQEVHYYSDIWLLAQLQREAVRRELATSEDFGWTEEEHDNRDYNINPCKCGASDCPSKVEITS